MFNCFQLMFTERYRYVKGLLFRWVAHSQVSILISSQIIELKNKSQNHCLKRTFLHTLNCALNMTKHTHDFNRWNIKPRNFKQFVVTQLSVAIHQNFKQWIPMATEANITNDTAKIFHTTVLDTYLARWQFYVIVSHQTRVTCGMHKCTSVFFRDCWQISINFCFVKNSVNTQHLLQHCN